MAHSPTIRRFFALLFALTATLTGVGVSSQDAPARTAEPQPSIPSLVRAHHNTDALGRLAALPGAARDTPANAYLRGRLLEREGRASDAAAAFATALAPRNDGASLPARVAVDARRRRARLLVRANQCTAAAPLLTELAVEGQRGALPRALLAECALMRGDHTDAVTLFRAVVAENGRDVDTFAAWLHLAEALALGGDRDAARAAITDALVARPEHPDASLAEARMVALGGPPTFTPAQRLQRAERLRARRMPNECLAELDAIPEASRPTGVDAAPWLHLRGMCLFKTRRHYAEAATVLAEAVRANPRGDTAVEDAFHAARALSRADRDDEAIAAYRAFAREHRRERRAAEAMYLAAWLELRHGRPRGEANMRRFIDGRHGARQPGRRRSALFELGLRAYERRRYAPAAELFDRYAAGGGGPMKAGKGRYWQGRALERAGRRHQAIAAYRRARATSPLHWYGLLAGQRLRALGQDPGPAIAPATPSAPAPLPPPALPEDARFYASLGLSHDASAALAGHADAIRGAAPRGRRAEALVAAYREIGATSAAFRVAALQRRALATAPDAANLWAWQAAYPRPHRDDIRRAATEARLHPAYLWATMRQESAFDSDAVSHADAIGLLQLLPRNAARQASRRGVPFRREMLFDPSWNVRFGAEEIGEHYRRYDGVMPLSIAAYNAGHHRVHAWLERSGRTDLDLFVERIPFDETRRYTRRVFSHYLRYRYLEDPSARITLPEQVGPRG